MRFSLLKTPDQADIMCIHRLSRTTAFMAAAILLIGIGNIAILPVRRF